MKNLTLVTGGSRSGKSSFTVEFARSLGKEVTFIATCVPEDEELKKRVERHRKNRPKHWQTIEEGFNLVPLLSKLGKSSDVVIIDCLTLFVSNLLLKGVSEKDIEDRVVKLIETVFKNEMRVILVTNEVGAGIVPSSELGRKFRDIAGRINQIAAKRADEVYFLVCGIPLKIKGG